MIARFAYPKLPQNLIAAIEILKLHNSNHAHFTFIGDGPTLNDCQQQVVQAGLENDVTFWAMSLMRVIYYHNTIRLF